MAREALLESRRDLHEPVVTFIHNIWTVALAVFIVNVPFGYWRAGVGKFSPPWFLAVHVPVPIVVGLRLLAGLAWRWVTFPLFVGAFFGGQFFGGKLRDFRKRRMIAQSCTPTTVEHD